MAFQLPEGIDKILPPETFQQLIAIHGDKNINGLERRRKLDELMRKVPKDVRDKIPLPPHLAKLPADVQSELRKIYFDDSLSFEDKAEKGRLYMKGLPEDTRKLIAPPGFENIPEDVSKKLQIQKLTMFYVV